MDTPVYTQMTNYDRACYPTFLTTLDIIRFFSVFDNVMYIDIHGYINRRIHIYVAI